MIFRRIVYLLILLAALFAQLFDVGYLVHYLFILILLLPVAGLLLGLPAILGCRPRWVMPAVIARRGAQVSWALAMGNRFPLPLSRVSFRLRIHNRMTGETTVYRREETGVFPGLSVPLRLPTHHCGYLECRVERLRVWDCLGLFSLPLKPPAPVSLLVGPIPVKAPPCSLPEQRGAMLPAPKGQAPTGEEYDLRGYRPGDSIRAIHWKLSAKRDQLVVRELLASRRPVPVLVFDHLGPPEELDHIIDQTAALSLALRQDSQPHEIRWAEPVSGTVRRFTIEDEASWLRCLTAILSDSAPLQGHSIWERPVTAAGEDPIFPVHIRREEERHEEP